MYERINLSSLETGSLRCLVILTDILPVFHLSLSLRVSSRHAGPSFAVETRLTQFKNSHPLFQSTLVHTAENIVMKGIVSLLFFREFDPSHLKKVWNPAQASGQ